VPKLYYASPRDLPLIEPYPGVRGRVVHADHATLVVYEYAPKTIVETHKHDVEEVGVVVRGSLAMVIAGEQRILMPGDSFRIPAKTAHGARVFEEPTQVVDVYAPPRTDLPRSGFVPAEHKG
jgi:mannose-6-phosphate isomerase-like protein (cupin superfamily)